MTKSATGKKEEFTTIATQYYTLLSTIESDLQQQVSALEEAGIFPDEAVSKDSKSDAFSLPSQGRAVGPRTLAKNRATVTGGGLGVDWLNSRNDNVGKEMEAELWKEASMFLSDKELTDKKILDEADDSTKHEC